MKKMYLLALILFLLASALPAQITINSNSLPVSPGTEVTHMNNGSTMVPVELGPSGVNQTWDFTSVQTGVEFSADYQAPASTPFYGAFPQATHCSHFDAEPPAEDGYQYYTLTSTDLTWLGQAFSYAGGDTITHVSTTSPQITFPFSYGSTWTSVNSYSFTGITLYDSTVYNVDAWGSITDALGTFNCLRVKGFKTTETIISGFSIIITHWMYQWYVPGYGVLVWIMSENNETNPNFTEGFFDRLAELISGVIPNAQVSAVPQIIELAPAYPNPFNPETMLSFSLPKAAQVTLNVLDPSGREITLLHSGRLPAGEYRAPFNAATLPSGTYFARLQAGANTSIQKLVLIK